MRKKGKGKSVPACRVPGGVGDKKQRRMEEIIDTAEKGMYRSGTNDPAWYSKSPQLVKDVASFPFGFPTGQEINLFSDQDPVRVPGVLVIGTGIAIGNAQGDLADPINVAASNLYSEIRQANSGHANYEAADLMMYIVCMDTLYSFHAWMRRLYGTAMAYTPTNKYYPKGVIKAMGVDPNDVFANLAQLRANINLFARSLASYRIPAKFSFITRHQWMYNSLFVDSTNSKAQTYLFNLDAGWEFDNTATSGTRLQQLGIASSGGAMKVSDIANKWNQLFVAIQNDEDINIMSGDILKAFPNDILIAPEIPENYTVLPVYDERVLMQIHNSSACGDIGMFAQNGQIVQDPSINGGAIKAVYNLGTLRVVGEQTYSWTTDGFNGPRILNYYKDDVSPDDVMEATRLMAMGAVTAQNDSSGVPCALIRYPYVGSEFVTEYTVWWLDTSATGSQWQRYTFTNCFSYNATNIDVATLVNNLIEPMAYVSQFDWAPHIMVKDTTNNATTIKGWFGDIAVYTQIHQEPLDMLHRVALLSELDYR